MPKRKTSTANVSAALYDGDFQLLYDCPGAVSCKYAICEIMPPEVDSNCFFCEHGSCLNTAAQNAAVEGLRRKLHGVLKQLQGDEA